MFFLFLSGLIIPVVMIIIGVIFKERPPAKINGFAGYRTSRSMKSLEAWTFANKYSGRLFYSYGIISFVVSVIILFLLRSQSNDFIGAAVAVLCLVQTGVIIFTIFPVEKALKEKFDEQGRPRS
jgi:uncharacterized membrane protein